MLKFLKIEKLEKLKNFRQGITLVEVLVVIAIIAALLLVLVSDFPKIQKQFALSRAAYRFAQDLRRAQDMALSGSEIKKTDGTALKAQGYGVYINLNSYSTKEYIIYADIDNSRTYNQPTDIYCSNYSPTDTGDCIIEKVNLAKEALGVAIKEVANVYGNNVSINFNPPNPTISISGLYPDQNRAGITFRLESDPLNSLNTRTVYISNSGLIEIK